jgi:hypothetical protein
MFFMGNNINLRAGLMSQNGVVTAAARCLVVPQSHEKFPAEAAAESERNPGGGPVFCRIPAGRVWVYRDESSSTSTSHSSCPK